MATATKHSTTPSPTSVQGSPQSPGNNGGNYHHIVTTKLSSPSGGNISSYESFTKRIQQGPPPRRGFVDDNQEEIEIAKQISDHAEAIYQTWKARGLAPTEILNCQLSTAAQQSANISLDPVTSPSAFHQRRLSPPPLSFYAPPPLSQTMPLSTGNSGGGAAALNELLAQPPDMSNNNKLEKLVNSFVNEDKARIAAQRRTTQLSTSSDNVEAKQPLSPQSPPTQVSPTKKSASSLPSLSSVSVIKQTLQKFENNNNSPSAKNFNLIKPKGQSPVLAKFGGPLVNGHSNRSEDRNNNSQDEEQLIKKNLLNSDHQQKRNVPDVLLNTISHTNGAPNPQPNLRRP